jgi:hypothetical protein
MLLLGAMCAGVAADEVGSVTFVEGYPDVVREGDSLPEVIDFGFRVENFDSIRTDEASALEVAFDPGTGIDATVAIEPDTHVYIDVSDLRTEQTGTLELVAGSVSVVARHLTGASEFQVRTPVATMGVRGTTFAVTGGPGGELLVTADEGVVEVSDREGRSLFAVPGEAVEIDEEAALLRTLRYDRDRIREFRRDWRARRLELFVEHAPRILRFYGRRYLGAREAFVEAYAQLMGARDVIDEWMNESMRGVRPSRDALRERRQLVRTVLRVRAAMARFEPVIARLDRMAPVVRELAPDVEIEPGVTAGDLYRTLANDRRIMTERLATVRHVLKLFAQRNNGETPFEFFERLEERRSGESASGQRIGLVTDADS